jgi:hypothetical protein
MKMIKYGEGLEGFFKWKNPITDDEHTMYLPTEARVKKVIDCKGEDWFDGKTILELGTAHGLIGRHFEKLGATVSYADARQELLDSIDTDSEKLCINHNEEWSFRRKWDLIIHFGTLYHVKNIYDDLRRAFNHTDEMFLETAVNTLPMPAPWFRQEKMSAVHGAPGEAKKRNCRVFNGFDQWEASFNDTHVEEYLDEIGKIYARYDDEDLDNDFGIIIPNEVYRRDVYSWTLEDVHPKNPNKACKFASIPPNYVHFRRFWHIKTPK